MEVMALGVVMDLVARHAVVDRRQERGNAIILHHFLEEKIALD